MQPGEMKRLFHLEVSDQTREVVYQPIYFSPNFFLVCEIANIKFLCGFFPFVQLVCNFFSRKGLKRCGWEGERFTIQGFQVYKLFYGCSQGFAAVAIAKLYTILF